MREKVKIIDTHSENVQQLGICGYKSMKRPGFPEKVEWLKKRFEEGMKIKTLFSEENGTQGMIEYLPGEICWRPVEASGYMFIHCLFVGFRRDYKGKGYASVLIDECELDARKEDMHGVAVVTRKSSFMVGKDIFIKRGYEVVDKAPSDFELLVNKFNDKAPTPKFKGDWEI